MKNRASIALRISVSVVFLWTALGVPLTQHMCSMMGAVGPFSVCEMDHSEEPDECCASDVVADESSPSGYVVTETAPGNCCTDVLLAACQQDDYTSAQQNAPVSPDAAFFAFRPYSSTIPPGGRLDAFSSGTSPPPLSGLYLIQSSLRI